MMSKTMGQYAAGRMTPTNGADNIDVRGRGGEATTPSPKELPERRRRRSGENAKTVTVADISAAVTADFLNLHYVGAFCGSGQDDSEASNWWRGQ